MCFAGGDSTATAKNGWFERIQEGDERCRQPLLLAEAGAGEKPLYLCRNYWRSVRKLRRAQATV